MRLWIKLVLGLVVLTVAALLGMYVYIDRTLCGSKEVRRLRSPDGRHEAVLYEFDCGATTNFTTQVAIVPQGAPTPHDAGNVLRADDNDGAAVVSREGIIEVTLRWLAVDTLLVRPDPKATVYMRATVVQGVQIVSDTSARGGA